jgi:hypothetical protein
MGTCGAPSIPDRVGYVWAVLANNRQPRNSFAKMVIRRYLLAVFEITVSKVVRVRTSSGLAIFCLVISAALAAQNKTSEQKPLSTWTVYGRQFTTALSSAPIKRVPAPQTMAVLTPSSSIVVRRIEAFSMLGPRQASLAQGLQLVSPAQPCPKQFFIIITNGAVTQSIPMSDKFLSKASLETYTDSGDLRLSFSAGNRITLSILAPDIEPPAPSCGAYDVTINVQYETVVSSKAVIGEGAGTGSSR